MDMNKYQKSATEGDGSKKSKSYITYVQLPDEEVAGSSEKQKMLNSGFMITRALRAQNVDVEKLVYEELLVPAMEQLNKKGK